MATCPSCQNVCDDTARFCPNCATPLAPQGGPPGGLQQRPQAGYQQPQAGYPQPQAGYQQPPAGYQQPQAGYQQPQAGFQQPPAGYQQPQAGYQQPPAGYQQPQAGYPTPPQAGAPNVVQPVAPAPFSGAPAPGGPAAMPRPQPGIAPMGAAPSAVPAGFGLQSGGPQGGAVPPAFAPAPPVLPKRKKVSPLRFIPFMLGPIITVGVVGFFVIGGGSCSSVEGQFVSAGEPVGTFTFMPKQCRSGERMDMHGAILVGEGPTEGGIMVIQDPVKGPIVKVELPGSCQPPSYEVCTEVTIDKSECTTFKVKIKRTNTTVNDIRLMDGSLELDCRFKEGGSVKAKLDFENCD